jgi:uncharacterized protein
MKQAELLIEKYYGVYPRAREILVTHSRLVRDKALSIAQRNTHLKVNLELLELGALLHDIGVLFTHAPEIGCQGPHPYICHGYLGRELLELEGLKKVALIAERHTGAGLTVEDIQSQNLPVPHRNMMPVSVEEQIVCLADKFYSKGKHPEREIPLEKVRQKLLRHGTDQLRRFDAWVEMFLQ